MGTLIVNQYLNKLWTPAEMTTTLWLDAADSSTITTVSGTVSEWEDKKNNGLILTTPNRPLYNASLNNLNVISFVRNSQHYLRTASFPSTGWSNLLVFVVTKWTTINSNSSADIQAIIDNGHQNSRGFVIQDRPDLSNDPLTYTRAPTPSQNFAGASDSSAPGNNTWKMYCGYSSATFDRLYRDGEVVSELANTEAFNFTNILNVGRWELNSRYLQGDIAEVVISPDATAIDKVFGYLAHKWGLTANLPVTHPYKNTPPYV